MNLIEFLSVNYLYILMLHNLGFVIGVGGATITDFLFFKFLKDFKLEPKEAEILNSLSPLIWTGLALLIISGIGLYLPQREMLNESPKFLAKMIVVAVILLNGIILNLLIGPKMSSILQFKEKAGDVEFRIVRKLRRFAFASGGISIVSWYSAFILGLWRGIPYSFLQIIIVYLILLLGAVAVGQVHEAYLTKKNSV
jgi:uncharacterized membrane protein